MVWQQTHLAGLLGVLAVVSVEVNVGADDILQFITHHHSWTLDTQEREGEHKRTRYEPRHKLASTYTSTK